MLFERIKLEANEQIIKVVRKHWWVIFVRLTIIVLTALVPLIPLLTLPTLEANLSVPLDLTAYTQVFWFGYTLWLLGCWVLVATAISDYYLDLWAITNRRIISVDQQGFFHRRLSSFRLERLQDMNIMVTGIIPTLLNYGTIEAQTAGGSNEEFKTKHMPDPRGLKSLIIQAADKRQRETGNYYQLTQEGL